MASTGQAAWDKYYRGRPDQQTIVKKDTRAYDDAGKFVTNMSKGDIVTVFESTSYTPKLKCKFKDSIVYINIDELVKPGSKYSNSVNLKPQAFNLVTSNPISLVEYMNRLNNTLDERNDLPGPLKSYLMLLVEYWNGNLAVLDELNTLFNQNKTSLPINEINKDFGEVLGPIAIIKHRLLSNLPISVSSQIYVPARSNEPLLDYKIGPYSISAKSGVTTNTVKPSDIIDLLNNNNILKAKYVNSIQYNILKILQENSALEGPPKALRYYLGEDKYKQWLNNNTYLKSKKSYNQNELMYEAEKELGNLSKNVISFIDIFTDAIRNKIIYVKYEITSGSSTGDFEIIMADDMKLSNQGRRPVFRTKNGYTRAADKLGIQI